MTGIGLAEKMGKSIDT